MAARVYVYAIAEAPARRRSIEGRTIETIGVAGLFAAIERRSRPPAVTERALRRQHAVVAALSLAAGAILPVRFGTFVTPAALEESLRERRTVLRAALRRIRGRVQMTIRLLGPAPPRAPAADPSTGRDYLLQRVASAKPLLAAEGERLRHALRPLASAERVEPGRGPVQASVHHLVRRDRVDVYRGRVESVLARLDPRPEIVLSGPWPPFAFAPDVWD